MCHRGGRHFRTTGRLCRDTEVLQPQPYRFRAEMPPHVPTVVRALGVLRSKTLVQRIMEQFRNPLCGKGDSLNLSPVPVWVLARSKSVPKYYGNASSRGAGGSPVVRTFSFSEF